MTGISATTAERAHPRARRKLGVGAAIILVLVVAALAVVIGGIRLSAQPVPDDASEVIEDRGAASLPPVYVHVFGAVHEPGLYRLEEGARVVDVIAAAGGLAEGADEAAVNLARRLTDGEHLRVPLVGEVPPPEEGGVASDGRVNLNTADADTLDTLPRIGPALAERILQWREDNGAFTSIEDLLAVPGIGEKMFASLRDKVTV